MTGGSDFRAVRSPWSGEIVGECHFAGLDDISRALEVGAKAALTMRSLRNYQRAEILLKAASLLREKREEFARMIALEGGKPIREARAEATRAESTFTLAGEAARGWGGELLPLDITPAAGDRVALVRKIPVGLVTGIAPFNFPLNLVAHKVAPAIATGCAINLKPASYTPLTALMLRQVLIEAGLPEGAFNVLPAPAALSDPLVEDPRVQLVTFTGSAEVGWGIKRRAWRRRVCLELGGNAAAIVDETADLDHAARRIAVGGYAHTGQICISVQNVLVANSVYDDFMAKFVPLVEGLKLGDPLDETTEVAALIAESEAVRIEEWIGEAVQAGGILLTGGERDGSRISPAILTDVPGECRIVAEEAFGPVTVVSRFVTFDEALERVNSWKFGLQAGVFTRDIKRAMMAFSRLETGGIIIDDVPTYRVDNFPYGGVKESGFGREGVRYAMEEMSELRTLVLPAPK